MSRTVPRLAPIALALAVLGGCDTVSETLNKRPPVDVAQPTSMRPQPVVVATVNNGSIFQAGQYRPLFEDHRARLVGDTLTVPLLSIELVAVCVAAIFSTICTVIVSPTRRARWSSNSGRYCVAWKIEPLLMTGAGAACGRIEVGCAMSTGGRGLIVSQAASGMATAMAANESLLLVMTRVTAGRGAAASRPTS